jgi:hypothetical protein
MYESESSLKGLPQGVVGSHPAQMIVIHPAAVNLALGVFSAQEKVNEVTRLEIRCRVEGIFGDDDKE